MADLLERAWPADHVERRPLNSLIRYARNAREHSPQQINQLAASMQEWGWTNPVLVDQDNVLIAGHGRILAADKLGWTEAPVMTATGWTKAQIAAYRLADNRLALSASWNQEMLQIELADLRDDGFALDLIGFDDAKLARFARDNGGEEDASDYSRPEKDPITRSGEVWILGSHRLICGDATDAAIVEMVMAGEQAALSFTSPPYAHQRNYQNPIGDWTALMQGVATALPLADEGQLLVNLGLVHEDGEWVPYWQQWIDWLREQGWRRFGWYVWDQGPGMPGDWNGRLAPSHEFIFHFNRISVQAKKTKFSKNAGQALSGQGLRKQDGGFERKTHAGRPIQNTKIADSVFRVNRQAGGFGEDGAHPAPFPVNLPAEVITAFSAMDDIVFEPFCGSGTTLIAAEKNGRRCRAVELAGVYCDLAVRRWQRLTEHAATLESTGQPFNDVERERMP